MRSVLSYLQRSSILVRILTYSIIALILDFSVLAIAINQIVSNQITTYTKETATIYSDEITERINYDHENIKALLEWIRYRLLEVDPEDPAAIEELSDFIDSLLTATPYVHCIWFSFEPGGFQAEQVSMDYVKTSQGNIAYFTLNQDILHNPGVAPWYYMPYTTGQIWFETADYYDYHIGTGFEYTDTVSLPLIRDGQIVGVAGIDTLYENQFSFLGEKDIENERLSLLMTYEGEIVYASDNRFLTRFIFDLPHGDSAQIQAALDNPAASSFEGISPLSGSNVVMFFNPVYSEFASKQLYLYSEIPVATLDHPAAIATELIVLLSIVDLLGLVFILSFLIRSNLKSIDKLTKNAQALADGQLDIDFVSGFELPENAEESQNEIVQLSAALEKMLERLNEVKALELREQALIADNATLDKLSKMKNEFFQNMSHDLKTPLAVISINVINMLDMLDFEVDDEDLRKGLSDVQKEVMRMARLVDLAIEQSSQKATEQGMEQLDLAVLLHNSVNTHRSLLERKNNSLKLEIPSALSPIQGNADTLLHVLSNLLANANRYTEDGEIVVGATETDGTITVTVKDTGSGIKPELLPHIFDRGVSDSGTGLGLHISMEAIEAHAGTIGVESSSDEGTSIFFILPVYQAQPDEEDSDNAK